MPATFSVNNKNLPTEVTLKVVECLDKSSRLNLQTVNRFFRSCIYPSVWESSHLKVLGAGKVNSYDYDYRAEKNEIKVNNSASDLLGLCTYIQHPELAYPLKEVRNLSLVCKYYALHHEKKLPKDCDLYSLDANELVLYFLTHVPADLFESLTGVKIHVELDGQPDLVWDFASRFSGSEVDIDVSFAVKSPLEPTLIPEKVSRLKLSTIDDYTSDERFNLSEVVASKYLNNIKHLELITNKNHPMTKQQLEDALEGSALESLRVTPHCIECNKESDWVLPPTVKHFEVFVPDFDEEWAPSLGSIASDTLESLRVPSNGENRLYSMRFPNLSQLHLEGTLKDAFKLPEGITTFCETSNRLEHLELSGFSMSDVAQIVSVFQSSLRSIVIQNTVKAPGVEYNLYQWDYLPQLEFLVVDFNQLQGNEGRTTKRLLRSCPRSVKLYIIDHKESYDSLWLTEVESPYVENGICKVNMLAGYSCGQKTVYELDTEQFMVNNKHIDV
ncbi:hypothetical protein TRVA0_001S08966 [Trichomonascus vanleenenianus]|uniref:F-box protein n=1 Tax=Trichomonascus vanleenenianus TaxID=2268995 RepID=UPI003ECA5517